MTRTSHALAADGRVWLVDPVDWPDAIERARTLGEPSGVLQLLDRHNRDCARLAQQLGVPHLVAPGEIPQSPFECIPVKRMKAGWNRPSGGQRRERSSSPRLSERTRSTPAAMPSSECTRPGGSRRGRPRSRRRRGSHARPGTQPSSAARRRSSTSIRRPLVVRSERRRAGQVARGAEEQSDPRPAQAG
jgi:hypothetical protein